MAVALAIGLLIGLERGWHTRDQEGGKRAAGIRTFALSGLLGGISGAVSLAAGPIVLGLLFLGFAGVFAAFQLLEASENKDLGATTVVAGLLTFCIGAYAVLGDLGVAAASAVAATLLLALRQPLHSWVAALSWPEIRAALILLTMTFLLLPVLPDRTIDPWDTVNPRNIWLLAIMIAAISFGGYLAVRHLGDRRGIVMASIAGGLASSTATTLSLARLGRNTSGPKRLFAAGIMLAGVVMAVRVGIVVALLNRALVLPLLPFLAIYALVLGTAAYVCLRRDGGHEATELEIANPLELGSAIKFAAFIAIIMLAAGALKEIWGDPAILALAAVSGIVDVDAVTISMARLPHGSLGLDIVIQAIVIAVSVNTLSKAAMAGWVGGREIGGYTSLASVAAVAAGGGALLLM